MRGFFFTSSVNLNAFYVISLDMYNRNLKVTKMNMEIISIMHLEPYGIDMLEFRILVHLTFNGCITLITVLCKTRMSILGHWFGCTDVT